MGKYRKDFVITPLDVVAFLVLLPSSTSKAVNLTLRVAGVFIRMGLWRRIFGIGKASMIINFIECRKFSAFIPEADQPKNMPSLNDTYLIRNTIHLV